MVIELTTHVANAPQNLAYYNQLASRAAEAHEVDWYEADVDIAHRRNIVYTKRKGSFSGMFVMGSRHAK